MPLFGRFFRRKSSLGKLATMNRVPIEHVRLFPVYPNTSIETPDFEITIPGECKQVEKPNVLEVHDITGRQHIVILKWALSDLSDFTHLKKVVGEVGASSFERLYEISGGHIKLLGHEHRDFENYFELRGNGHDPFKQMLIGAFFVADVSKLLSFTFYRMNVPEPDEKNLVDMKKMFDSFKWRMTRTVA